MFLKIGNFAQFVKLKDQINKYMYNGSHQRRTGRYFSGRLEKTNGLSSAVKQTLKKMHKKKQRQFSKKTILNEQEKETNKNSKWL